MLVLKCKLAELVVGCLRTPLSVVFHGNGESNRAGMQRLMIHAVANTRAITTGNIKKQVDID